MAVAMTIAGSDSSGGAGIQADLRTFAALGVVGVSAITALTVQNSQGVQSVHPVPADVLAAQITAILEDTKVDAVKIGMLGGAEQVHAVAAGLRRFRPPNIVLDPVLASTGGVPLLDEEGRQLLLSKLLPLCDLVTPNTDETFLLTGTTFREGSLKDEACRRLLDLGPSAILIKGGHLPGDTVHDMLLFQDGSGWGVGLSRVATPHTHGTGCFLSAAIAAYLAQGTAMEDAFLIAKDLITSALETPIAVGKGRGYPDITFTRGRHDGFWHANRLSRFFGVYVLTDPMLRPERAPEEIVSAALAEGARIIQLRDKNLSTPQLADLARRVSPMVHQERALLIVNDRVEVALMPEVDGVHLGPDDMYPADARRLLGPEKLIGVSVSSIEEARPLALHASYLGVGAIFGSKTKTDAGEPVGVERMREIKAAFPHIPIVAIGGINLDNIAEVARAGSDAAAVVSAVVAAPDMAEATRELVRLFHDAKQS